MRFKGCPQKQGRRKTNITGHRLCVESKNMIQMSLFTKWKHRLTDIENKPTVTKGGSGGGG